eukprot:INCI16323.4.p1 GENE.INCI16323.4~~INCI16323.4.p1  ORF type:complete len:1394 (-),score=200.36 INCI16323.4:176-4312(-)
MGNEIACLRCNGTLDGKVFGKVLGPRGAPSRGELELLVALQGLYNAIPRRLVEVLKQVYAALGRNQEYRDIERIDPTILKFARPYDREPVASDGFRETRQFFQRVEVTVSKVWVDEVTEAKDLVMKMDLNYNNFLWDGDVVFAVDGVSVRDFSDTDETSGSRISHPIWAASARGAFKLKVGLRPEEQAIVKQINVLHRFSPDRTLELLKFCIDNHRSALQFPRQCVVQTISGRLMLQDMLREGDRKSKTLATLGKEFGSMCILRPRRTLHVLEGLAESFQSRVHLEKQQQQQLHQIFKVNAIEGFGLSVEELMDAFATLVAAGPEKADEAIRRGSIPPALKKAVASDKLWHVWWCCREIVRVGAIEYMHKVQLWRQDFLSRVSDRERCVVWLDAALPVEALRPLNPVDPVDSTLLPNQQPILAYRYGRLTLYSKDVFLGFLEAESEKVDKPGGGPHFTVSGNLWTGDAVVSICGVDVRGKQADEIWHLIANRRGEGQPVVIGFDYFPQEMKLLRAVADHFVLDAHDTAHCVMGWLAENGSIAQLPLPSIRHPINKKLKKYESARGAVDIDSFSPTAPRFDQDESAQSTIEEGSETLRIVDQHPPANAAHTRDSSVFSQVSVVSNGLPRQVREQQNADRQSAHLYASLGGHCGGNFSYTPPGADQAGAHRWLLRALVAMEESNERHYRRACKRLLGTQELWDESARHGDVSPGLQLLKGHALERLKFLGKQQEKLYHLPMLESAAEVGFLGLEFNDLPLVPLDIMMASNRHTLFSMATTPAGASAAVSPAGSPSMSRLGTASTRASGTHLHHRSNSIGSVSSTGSAAGHHRSASFSQSPQAHGDASLEDAPGHFSRGPDVLSSSLPLLPRGSSPLASSDAYLRGGGLPDINTGAKSTSIPSTVRGSSPTMRLSSSSLRMARKTAMAPSPKLASVGPHRSSAPSAVTNPRHDVHAGLPVPNWGGRAGKKLPFGQVDNEAMGSPKNEMAYAVFLMLCGSALQPLLVDAVSTALHSSRGRVYAGPQRAGALKCKGFAAILDRTAKSYRHEFAPSPAANHDVCRLRATFKTSNELVTGFKALVRCPGVTTVLRVDNSFHYNYDALRRPHAYGMRSLKVTLLFQPTSLPSPTTAPCTAAQTSGAKGTSGSAEYDRAATGPVPGVDSASVVPSRSRPFAKVSSSKRQSGVGGTRGKGGQRSPHSHHPRGQHPHSDSNTHASRRTDAVKPAAEASTGPPGHSGAFRERPESENSAATEKKRDPRKMNIRGYLSNTGSHRRRRKKKHPLAPANATGSPAGPSPITRTGATRPRRDAQESEVSPTLSSPSTYTPDQTAGNAGKSQTGRRRSSNHHHNRVTWGQVFDLPDTKVGCRRVLSGERCRLPQQ